MLFLPPLSELPLKEHDKGVILYIKATPKASKNSLGKIEKGLHHPVLKVYIQAPATDGSANKAIIAFLKDALKVKSITMINGQTQRLKALYIEDATLKSIAAKII